MARIIRCPNCGENVEVPPNPSGQMVTCIACGTVMRLKSKKDALGAGGAKPPGDSSSTGSFSASVVAPAPAPQKLKPGSGADEGDLVPLAGDDQRRPAARGKSFTIGAPFIGGCTALVIYVACEMYLALFPKPVGTKLLATAINPPAPSDVAPVQPQADDPNASSSADPLAPSPTTNATPAPSLLPPAVLDSVPDTVAARPNSVFDDWEVTIVEKLNAGMASLRAALALSGDTSVQRAKEALILFSEARSLLAKEERTTAQDPAWTISNHGTAAAYVLLGNEPLARDYLGRLPTPPDRTATINRAVLVLRTSEDKSEAVATLLEHLKSPPGAEDAYALDLLGTALAASPADADAAAQESLKAARAEYAKHVARFESRRPNERRWGVRWISREEHAKKEKTRQQAADLERKLAGVRNTIKRSSDGSTAQKREELTLARKMEQEFLGKLEPLRLELTEPWLEPAEILPALPDLAAFDAKFRAAGATTQPAARP